MGIYTNAAFLAAADSKRFVLFNVKDGNFVGVIQIPNHLERNKGKDEKDCMFEQTGLGLFIFDENKLIAVHDYERSFPAVLDISARDQCYQTKTCKPQLLVSWHCWSV